MSEQLRESFQELRAHERAETPPFDVVMAGARIGPSHRSRFVFGGMAAAAALAALLLWPRPINQSFEAPSITKWRAPTDVLLNTPGSHLLSELPALDQSILDMEAL